MSSIRRKDREITDIHQILEIVGRTKYLHLGLYDGEFPYVVALHYGAEFQDGVLTFYLHGAKEGHKLDLIRQNPHVCIELECDAQLIPAGDNACAYGSSYASVIGRGTAQLLDDPNEKIHGLKVLMEHQTGRDFGITPQMASSVAVIRITVPEFTAKARPLPAG